MKYRVLATLFAVIACTAPTTLVYGQTRGSARNSMNTNNSNSVLLPNRSPLISFRILFMTGAASDPKGKEGLASLTAAMLAEGGTRTKTYAEITDAMYPMATSFGWQVDKEMTVFSGTTHADNLDKYYSLIREMLLEPGFREDDFSEIERRGDQLFEEFAARRQ